MNTISWTHCGSRGPGGNAVDAIGLMPNRLLAALDVVNYITCSAGSRSATTN
jgi:hypothetical protein